MVKGRAGVVIKNTFLKHRRRIRRTSPRTSRQCNLHDLDLPSGTFQGAGVRAVVLFFEKGTTKKIWYYQLNPGAQPRQTNPLGNGSRRVLALKKRPRGANSWVFDVNDIGTNARPHRAQPERRAPEKLSTREILAELRQLDAESVQLWLLVTELRSACIGHEQAGHFNHLRTLRCGAAKSVEANAGTKYRCAAEEVPSRLIVLTVVRDCLEIGISESVSVELMDSSSSMTVVYRSIAISLFWLRNS